MSNLYKSELEIKRKSITNEIAKIDYILKRCAVQYKAEGKSRKRLLEKQLKEIEKEISYTF